MTVQSYKVTWGLYSWTVCLTVTVIEYFGFHSLFSRISEKRTKTTFQLVKETWDIEWKELGSIVDSSKSSIRGLSAMELIYFDCHSIMIDQYQVDWLTLYLNFLFVYFNLQGITVTLGAVVGLPFLYISDIIVKKTGRIVLLLGGFFVYALRFIGYSFITWMFYLYQLNSKKIFNRLECYYKKLMFRNPWLSLPFEALEAVTVHLMGISMSLFCASAAPQGLLATLHGLAGSVHYSIGNWLCYWTAVHYKWWRCFIVL